MSRNIFENEEMFTASATISAGYYMINQINKELQKPKSAINSLIDKATGYDKHLQKQNINELIEILGDIIEAKKIIEADYSEDEKMIKTLKNITNE